MAVEQAGSTLSIRRRPRTNCSGSASDLGWCQRFSVGTSPSHRAERGSCRDSKPFLLPGQRSHQLRSAGSPGRPNLSSFLCFRNAESPNEKATTKLRGCRWNKFHWGLNLGKQSSWGETSTDTKEYTYIHIIYSVFIERKLAKHQIQHLLASCPRCCRRFQHQKGQGMLLPLKHQRCISSTFQGQLMKNAVK